MSVKKLEIVENKTLKLLNVFSKKLENIAVEKIDNEIQKFINFVDVSKFQVRGPLITKDNGTKISEAGEITLDYDVMVQTINKVTAPNFEFYPELKVPGCLYVHFEGLQEEFQYAQSKLDLYIWENDLIATGEQYVIHLQELPEHFIADVFIPLR